MTATKTCTASIILPWPDRILSPNARPHWAALARQKRQAKRYAFYIAKEAGLHALQSNALKVRYTFHSPSLRRFDLDNVLAAMKAAADGISEAICIDDSKWQITLAKGHVERPRGKVCVDLEWIETGVHLDG